MPLIPWNGAWDCINCGNIRYVHDGICEECGVCKDERFDIAMAEEEAPEIPVLVEDTHGTNDEST